MNFLILGMPNVGKTSFYNTITLENSDSFEDDSGHYQHTLRKEVAEALEIVGGI